LNGKGMKNIFAEKELEEYSVAKVFLATAADGKKQITTAGKA